MLELEQNAVPDETGQPSGSGAVPTVSIGMPVFNGENFVCEAIDSLLAQSFTDFELLISDNASSDRTQAICEAYAARDRRIRYVRQDQNIGAGRNFEFVLDHTRGQFFMWAAHDDVWAANWLEVLVEQMHDGVFAARGTVRFLRDGAVVAERRPPDYGRGNYLRFFMAEETTMNARNFYIYGLFNRAQLLLVDRSALSLDYYPEYLYVFEMLKVGSLRTVSQTHQLYRLHAQNSGTRMMQKNLGWPRLLYCVHPVAYYREYLNAAPRHLRLLIAVAAPVKHLYNQVRLWIRGFRRIVFRSENI